MGIPKVVGYISTLMLGKMWVNKVMANMGK